MELAPLRDLEDFMLNSARFKTPDLHNPGRLFNRIHQNLIYYQTNYFLIFILSFLILAFLNPTKTFTGIVLGAALKFALYYAWKSNYNRSAILKGGAVIGALTLYLYTSALIVYFMGIMLPLLIVVLHATLRLRNIKNKIANKIYSTKEPYVQTPMSFFLNDVLNADFSRNM